MISRGDDMKIFEPLTDPEHLKYSRFPVTRIREVGRAR
jgi:hypothetical protein